ncbi:MAG: VWA domain-containing protein, partial [Hyphomicrobiaceae bacterium]|nr:VWA domain-containing protein [Hyphomicrobiaceae bacterium]
VGDASMSPYEIAYPGGSVEHWNAEPGALWMKRFVDAFPKMAWINPVPEEHWGFTHSISMIRDIIGERMFPLTLDGLDRAARLLAR